MSFGMGDCWYQEECGDDCDEGDDDVDVQVLVLFDVLGQVFVEKQIDCFIIVCESVEDVECVCVFFWNGEGGGQYCECGWGEKCVESVLESVGCDEKVE